MVAHPVEIVKAEKYPGPHNFGFFNLGVAPAVPPGVSFWLRFRADPASREPDVIHIKQVQLALVLMLDNPPDQDRLIKPYNPSWLKLPLMLWLLRFFHNRLYDLQLPIFA